MYRLYLLSTKALKPNIIMGIWYKLTVTAEKYLRTYFMQTSVHSPIQCINEDEWFSVKTPDLLLWWMSTYVWIGLTHTHQTITLFNTNFARESNSRITNVHLSVCQSSIHLKSKPLWPQISDLSHICGDISMFRNKFEIIWIKTCLINQILNVDNHILAIVKLGSCLSMLKSQNSTLKVSIQTQKEKSWH